MKKLFTDQCYRAFSLLEVLLVLIIIMITVGLATAWTSSAISSVQLQTSTESVVGVLRNLQSAAHSRYGNVNHGIKLEATQYTSFEGNDLVSSDPASRNLMLLAKSIEIQNISLTGGVDEIVFVKGAGSTVQDGTFQVVHTPTSDYYTISISPIGLIDWN